MSLSKFLQSLSIFAAVTVFALSVAIIPTTSAATTANGGVSPPGVQDSEHPYVDLITATKRKEAGRLQAASTQQALAMMKNCNEKVRAQNDRIINLADWSACLNKKLKTKIAQCKEVKNKQDKATCNFAAHKFKAAADRATSRLKEQAKAKSRLEEIKHPRTYSACMDRFSTANNISKLQSSAKKLINNRSERLNKLKVKANKIKDNETRQVALDGIAADQKELSSIEKQVAAMNDNPSEVAQAYCEVAFKMQVNTFRAKQVAALVALDKGIRADTIASKVFNHPSNQTTNKTIAQNALKDNIVSRLDKAREGMNTSTGILAYENNLLKAVKEAQVTKSGDGYTNSLAGMDLKAFFTQIRQARTEAWRNYNEAQVLRKVQNDYSADQQSRITLKSITLQNKNGDTIKRDGTVVVKPKQDKDDNKKKAEGLCAKLEKPSKERQHCLNKYYGEESQKDEGKQGQKADAKKAPSAPRKAYVKVTIGSKEYTTKITKNGNAKAWRVVRDNN